MKIVNKPAMLVSLALTTAVTAWALSRSVITGSLVQATAQDKARRDPCWFVTLKDKTIPYEEIAEREERERRGYPSAIPLSEAVRVFNAEKQCDQTLAPYPPLSEDEVVAAIVAGPGYGEWGEVWKAQQGALYKIAKELVMPKGSLIVATGGPNVQESPLRPDGDIKARGISIAVFLGLDEHENGPGMRKEQIFEVRRTYFKVEMVK